MKHIAARDTTSIRVLVVLSPHLDDAVLSVGATLHSHVRRGVDVRVVTVLANDPDALGGAGSWDAACGFPTAAEAARRRRDEDRRACAVLGASPRWFPYGDATYARGASDEAIWHALRHALGDADLLLTPGFPLVHPDHRWLTDLIVRRRRELSCRLCFYAEQPYSAGSLLAARTGTSTMGTVMFLRALAAPERVPAFQPARNEIRVAWKRVASSPGDRVAKLKAILSYRTQLRPLGLTKLAGAQIEELVRKGELIGWT
jgi:LmbE family N-acetylglucosaminyl deacetylase